MGGVWKIASCSDVHFLMYLFQGSDATVGDSFPPLGPPVLPWENRMGRGQTTNNNTETNIATTRPNSVKIPFFVCMEWLLAEGKGFFLKPYWGIRDCFTNNVLIYRPGVAVTFLKTVQ